jgi:hypothetical protein
MRPVRASEIGTYVFCQRAWWYQKQGVESLNQAEMSGGSAFHHAHGRQTMAASLLRLGGWILLGLSLVILVVMLVIMGLH